MCVTEHYSVDIKKKWQLTVSRMSILLHDCKIFICNKHCITWTLIALDCIKTIYVCQCSVWQLSLLYMQILNSYYIPLINSSSTSLSRNVVLILYTSTAHCLVINQLQEIVNQLQGKDFHTAPYINYTRNTVILTLFQNRIEFESQNALYNKCTCMGLCGNLAEIGSVKACYYKPSMITAACAASSYSLIQFNTMYRHETYLKSIIQGCVVKTWMHGCHSILCLPNKLNKLIITIKIINKNHTLHSPLTHNMAHMKWEKTPYLLCLKWPTAALKLGIFV